MSSNAADAEVFVYTGNDVPRDVVHVRVDPSVTSIPARAFSQRTMLTEVELCEGLVEIGVASFEYCDHSITTIKIPISLRRIKDYAFHNSLRTPIHLHDGIESIGTNAFAHCIFTNFRVPLLITVIPAYMLRGCKSLFSVEIPHNVMEIGHQALAYCYCLRNVAFPPTAVIGHGIFIQQGMTTISDLQQLFGSIAEIIRMLQHRFDELPIHSIVYYLSYHEGELQILITAINRTLGQRLTLNSMLDPRGNEQDCLGMTPLHILACSSVHKLEVYRMIIENYPTNLITEDRWGALPLLYAFWGAAPTEIIHVLLESYQLHYPDHVFNWTMMVETMGRCDTPKESIENMLNVKQKHFPEQPIDWGYLLDEFAEPSIRTFPGVPFRERMRFLFTCGMSDRVKALAFKVWRDHITTMIQSAASVWTSDNVAALREIRAKLDHFEDKYPKLKEAMTTLELASWKLRMNENNISTEEANHHQKKVKTDESSMRIQCRITCGANIIIRHTLPFLISVVD